MPSTSGHVNFIWSIAERLRGAFLPQGVSVGAVGGLPASTVVFRRRNWSPMARVIPKQPSPDSPRSERVVHAALATLPDPWIVLADVPIGLFGRPRPGMAQLDFLLVHPKGGLCVLEVKGGSITVAEGTWYTAPRGGQPQALRRSPFAQAADQRYELQRFLWKHLPIPDEAMAHAVALPDCVVTTSLGPEAPRSMVLDKLDLQDAEAAVNRAVNTWKTRLSLSDADTDRLVALLKPSADLTIVLAADVALTEDGLQRETRRQVKFTDSQLDAYQAILRQERAVVLGEAGTGKTVLAVDRAQRLVDAGMRTLLLCHRAGALAFIGTLMGTRARRKLDLKQPQVLTIAHFAGLLDALAEETEQSHPRPESAALPDWLLSTAEQVGLRFDALVVDEGQEFTPAQLEALMWLLPDPEHSPVYIFADPFQHSARFSTVRLGRDYMRGRYKWHPPTDMPIVTLVDNVRNSTEISQAVGHFLADQESTARISGPEPEVLTREPNRVVATGIERVQQLLAQDGFSANQVLVVVVGLDKQAAMRATRKAMDVVDVSGILRFPLPPADLRVAFGTADDVQGLEAEVVVVLHGTRTPSVGGIRDLYIACSRARSHLVIVGPHTLPQLRITARNVLRSAASES